MEDPRQKAINDTLKCLDAALNSPINKSSKEAVNLSRTTHNVTKFDTSQFNDSVTFGVPSAHYLKSGEEEVSFLYDVTVPLTDHGTSEINLDQTSAAILAQDDPGIKAAQVLFSEFVNIFVSHTSDAQIWDEISAYEKLCAQQAETLKKIIRKVPRHHSNFVKTEQMALRMIGERNTWRLLGTLFYERLEEEINESDQTMVDITEEKTDKTIIGKLFDTNAFIRQAQNVVDWLEKNAEDDHEGKYFDRVDYFGNTHVAWENTLRVAKNEKDLQRGVGSAYGIGGIRPLVTSLDPDAPLRQKRPLHDLDQEEDQRLVKCMFACVRAGQLSDAQELCAKSGQHWRAATLEGWKLYDDPNPNDRARNPVVGNRYRDVWKAIAWRAASDDRLPTEERAMYGALCGHLPAMLEVCHSFEDQLWAYFRTLVDQRVEETLRGNSCHLRSLHALPKEYPEEKLTLPGIFKDIETRLGHQLGNSYHIIQKYFILNDIEGLISTAHGWIKEGPISPHLLRCLTHLLLILKRFGRVPYEQQDQMTDILHACVKEAMERGDIEQVARYSSVLPEWLQVRCYADFLINICDEHHRQHALSLASLVGLDTQAITATVVTKIRLSPGSESSSEIIADTTVEDKVKINALDWLLYDNTQRPEALRQANAMIRHFLVSRKTSAAKTLFQRIPTDSIDIIIKLQEGKTGKTDLPTHIENRVREYLCFRTFLDAQESFTDWFDHYHQKKPSAPKKPKTGCTFPEQLAYDHALQQHNTDNERWKHTLDLITKKACERLYNVLLFPDGGWLVDLTPLPLGEEERKEEEDEEEMRVEDQDSFWETVGGGRRPMDMSSDDKLLLQHLEPEIASREPNRAHQLTTLRSIYIPQAASLLQNMLHSTGSLKECIQLTDVIASEQHGLYKCYGVGEMQRFLFKLQETSKELLDTNRDALGYPLS